MVGEFRHFLALLGIKNILDQILYEVFEEIISRKSRIWAVHQPPALIFTLPHPQRN